MEKRIYRIANFLLTITLWRGLARSAVTQGKSLVFLLCLASFAVSAQSWNAIGTDDQLAAGNAAYTSVVVIGTVSPVPYVSFTEGGILKVKKYEFGEWTQVGSNLSSGSSSYSKIYVDKNDQLYVVYVDGNNSSRVAVKMYDAGADTWSALGGDDVNLHVSAGNVSYSSPSQYSTSNRVSLSFDSNNVPYVAFGEGSSDRRPTVRKFESGAWITVGGGVVASVIGVSVNVAVDEETNTPYVTFVQIATATTTTGTLKAYRLSSGAWQELVIPNPVPNGSSSTGNATSVRHSTIAFNSAWNPVLSYFNVNNSNRSTIITYNKSTESWAYNGVTSTRDIANNSLVRDGSGNLYNTFTDLISNNSGRSVARVIRQSAGQSTWSELKDPNVEVGIDEPSANPSVAASSDGEHVYFAYIQSSRPIVRKYSGESIPTEPEEPDEVVTTARQMEKLTRGVVAVRLSDGSVYVGWRMFGTDPTDVSFNVYKNGVKLNGSPITNSTNFVDAAVNPVRKAGTNAADTYAVAAIINGTEGTHSVPVEAWSQFYKQILLDIPASQTMPDGSVCTYTANDCSVGDLDGDGEYEIILKWDPSNSKDNSQSGYTGTVFLDAYKLDGTRLWRINLGRNIRAGAHYTQFMVYDFDGDGKAEISAKTADGTIDGNGLTIGDPLADYRNSSGYVLSGPEFLTIFNGQTGAAMATINYLPARGTVSSWGDSYGNRVDRFVDAIAYLDGQRPSLITGRGYYTRLVRVAWDWRDGQLTNRWIFDSNTFGNASYMGQGNHQLSIADVDGDGKDEIINGASVVNDNGRGLFRTGMGHGDALHVSDMDPDRPGLELWQCYEDPGSYNGLGLQLWDMSTRTRIFGVPTTGDVGRAMAADIDPNHKGYELWGASSTDLYNVKGQIIANSRPSRNFGIWWDGDLGRELLDGVRIDKWNPSGSRSDVLQTFGDHGSSESNNTTKATPGVTADILGDWREEVIFRSSDNQYLNIFTTTIPTEHRLYTLMHNPQYRAAVAWQNTAYNQPPYPDYYLGYDMETPPQPNIYLAGADAVLPVSLVSLTATHENGAVLVSWQTATESNSSYFDVERSVDGKNFARIARVTAKGNSDGILNYTALDESPLPGVNYYRLKQVDVDTKFEYSRIVSVQMEGKRSDLVVSPNPVLKEVQFSLQEVSPSSKLSLKLVNVLGMEVMTAEGNLEELNRLVGKKIGTLVPGTYLVQLTDQIKVYNGRLLKSE